MKVESREERIWKLKVEGLLDGDLRLQPLKKILTVACASTIQIVTLRSLPPVVGHGRMTSYDKLETPFKSSVPQILSSSNPQILSSSNTQILNSSNTQLLKYSNTQFLEYSNTHPSPPQLRIPQCIQLIAQFFNHWSQPINLFLLHIA